MPTKPRAGRSTTANEIAAKSTSAKQLQARFHAVHVAGIKAIKQHDYDALGEAIAKERAIIEAQAELIAAQRRAFVAATRKIGAGRTTEPAKAKLVKTATAKQARKKRRVSS